MNDLVTPEGWLQRSQSVEYINAYRRLVEFTPINFKGVMTEVGCGPAGLLARLFERSPNSLVIGTDISDEMLSNAQTVLASRGIPSEIKQHPRELDLTVRRKVVLVKDNLVDSEMPSNISDYSFFIFPETGEGHPVSPLDTELANRWIRASGLNTPEMISIIISSLRAEYHLSRITKRKGVVIRTHYDISEGNFNDHDERKTKYESKYSGIFGRRMSRCFFTEDLGIWSDTVPAKAEAIYAEHIKKGYWTIVAKKTE
ncbi:MAG: class I SAM-dependent methyltransferase [Nanoarchaeota archaeon]